MMINITEEQLKEIVTQAHMAGQHSQTGCDPSYFEAETHWQKQVKNLGIFSVSACKTMAFSVGDKVKITCRRYGHGFDIGEEVYITEVDSACEDYEATNNKETWQVADTEIMKCE